MRIRPLPPQQNNSRQTVRIKCIIVCCVCCVCVCVRFGRVRACMLCCKRRKSRVTFGPAMLLLLQRRCVRSTSFRSRVRVNTSLRVHAPAPKSVTSQEWTRAHTRARMPRVRFSMCHKWGADAAYSMRMMMRPGQANICRTVVDHICANTAASSVHTQRATMIPSAARPPPDSPVQTITYCSSCRRRNARLARALTLFPSLIW